MKSWLDISSNDKKLITAMRQRYPFAISRELKLLSFVFFAIQLVMPSGTVITAEEDFHNPFEFVEIIHSVWTIEMFQGNNSDES